MNEVNTKFTAAQALKQLNNVSKRRLYKLMNDGTLSYEKERYGNNKERRVIDASELYRVFKDDFSLTKKEISDTVTEPLQKTDSELIATHETVLKNNVLEDKIEFLNEQYQKQEELYKNLLEEAKTREQDLSAKLDKAQSTIEKQTHMISDMRENPPEKPVEKTKGFWARVVGA